MTTPLPTSADDAPARPDVTLDPPALTVDFAGELYYPRPGRPFWVGREGDLVLDDNPYLHRRLMEVEFDAGMWWIVNSGSRIAISLTDAEGLMRSWMSPGVRLPLIFGTTIATFTAGDFTYELHFLLDRSAYAANPVATTTHGEATIGATTFTPSQRLLMLALAEPVLRRPGTGVTEVPASQAAADRLGWRITKFNRKLDNVCTKLDALGVRGLRGGRGNHSTNRRLALVEHAVLARLVTAEDLPLLDMEFAAQQRAGEAGDDHED